MKTTLENTVGERRRLRGLSQAALANTVGVSRQAISGIEAGRQVPSTELALKLARALGCGVEDLFQLRGGDALTLTLAGEGSVGQRIALARVQDDWVGHPVAGGAVRGADAVLKNLMGQRGEGEPLEDVAGLSRNVLVAGCAPLLGLLAERVANRFRDARLRWVEAGSQRALELLRDGLLHVAGLHLVSEEGGDANQDTIRAMFPDRAMTVVNLTRWRQGLLVPAGNPMSIEKVEDLCGREATFVHRETGAGAQKLVNRLLMSAGVEESTLAGPTVHGHDAVAQMVATGVADAGVAIESVALARGLEFIPLSEERFDLVVPGDLLDFAPVQRVLSALQERAFRMEAAHIPGYDATILGHVTTVEAR